MSKRAQIYDQLFLRNNVAWPANDRPGESRIARLLSLILQKNGIAAGQFWNDHGIHGRAGRFLVYVDFGGNYVDTAYSLPDNKAIAGEVASGLRAWEDTKAIRFNESMLSFAGIGLESARKFATSEEIAVASRIDGPLILPTDVAPVLAKYNKSRSEIRRIGRFYPRRD